MIEFHVVVVVVGEGDYHKKIKLFLSLCLPYKWRGVTPHSEIIVGDEPPCIF